MNRRSVLRTAGLIGLSSTAGCIGRIPSIGETTLGWFAIYNFHESSGHRFDVRIERDGTTVHESSHHLQADQHEEEAKSPPHAVISCTWDNTPGDFTVFVRSDGRGWQRFNVLDTTIQPPDCVIAYVEYGDNFGPSEDPPKFTFELDETDCAEVHSLPGGCPWVD